MVVIVFILLTPNTLFSLMLVWAMATIGCTIYCLVLIGACCCMSNMCSNVCKRLFVQRPTFLYQLPTRSLLNSKQIKISPRLLHLSMRSAASEGMKGWFALC